MSKKSQGPDIYDRKMIDVLTPSLTDTVQLHYTVEQLKRVGTTREDDFAGEGSIPNMEIKRYIVSAASVENGSYNCHPTMTKWKGKYWYGWMSHPTDEERPGQSIYVSSSDDGTSWPERRLAVDGDDDDRMFRTICAFIPYGDKLYMILLTHWLRDDESVDPGMADTNRPTLHYKVQEWTQFTRTDLWVTNDGITWREDQAGFLDIYRTTESPRLTPEGRLMAFASTNERCPAVVLWPGNNPAEQPEVIKMPFKGKDAWHFSEGHDYGMYLYGEGSWYADDDSRLWMWMRDDSGSSYLGCAISEDGGESWTEPMRSNFPDSTSRIVAGRLKNGRYFIAGNSTRVLMDRSFFAISFSEDGAKFGEMYRLFTEPTVQGFEGHLKMHGYQNPACLVDGDRILLGYAVNKEDMEIGIIETSKMGGIK
jgi:hypothetical protein